MAKSKLDKKENLQFDKAHSLHGKVEKILVECEEFKDYQELPLDKFNSYGPIPNKLCEVLGRLDRSGNTSLYDGFRLLVKRSITQEGLKKGRFLARLATEDFCFCDSIYGVKLPDNAKWEAKLLLGIFWSSLTRY